MLFMKPGGLKNELLIILGMFLVFGLVMHCSMKEDIVQPEPINIEQPKPENPISLLNDAHFNKDLQIYVSNIPGLDKKEFIEKQYTALQNLKQIPNNEYSEYLLAELIIDHYPDMVLIEQLYNAYTMGYNYVN